MKVFKFTLVCSVFFILSFCSEIKGQNQVALNDLYKNYYRISDKQFNRSWDRWMGTGDYYLNIYGYWGYHGGDNQKWLIMPTYPGSSDYFIADKATGGIADIWYIPNWGLGNVYSYPEYTHGGNNQVFKFTDAGNGEFYIGSPLNAQNYISCSNTWEGNNPYEYPWEGNHNIYFGSFTGLDNQKFKLTPSEGVVNGFTSYLPQRNTVIPQPPAPTSLSDPNICIKCNETIVGETIIPFTMVRNDLPRSIQVKQTPYYKIVRKQYWRMVGTPKTVNPGINHEIEFTQTKGIEHSQLYEVATKLNIGFTVNAEASYTGVAASGSVSTSFSRSFEISKRQVTSLTTNQEDTFRYKKTINVDRTTLYVEYQLVDEYILQRMNGHIVMEWEVAHPSGSNTEVAYPTITGKLATKRVLIEEKKNENLPKNNFSAGVVYPNPFINMMHIEVNTPEACDIEVILYNESGREIKKLNKNVTQKGAHTISIEANGLPKGVYILKGHLKGINDATKKYEFIKKVIKK